MHVFEVREPISALSHGAGMMLALPVTWMLWKRCGPLNPGEVSSLHAATRSCPRGPAAWTCPVARHQRLKALSLLVFGISLTFCYAASMVFHAVPSQDERLRQLRSLDHIGIYLLIAGTYTPIVWSLLGGRWRSRTLATVWTITPMGIVLAWYGHAAPTWVLTLTYLAMGWGSLVCYRELARSYSHRRLMPLTLGGMIYTIGAVLNLAKWPVLYSGVFAAHELFHLFVIAGSACHIYFMLNVVIPAPGPMQVPSRSRTQAALLFPPPWTRRTWVRAELLPVCVEPSASRFRS